MNEKYVCHGHRPVVARDLGIAASIFAGRKARAEFGTRGEVRTYNLEGVAEDFSFAECSAFVGTTTPGNPHEFTGKEVRFTVHVSISPRESEYRGVCHRLGFDPSVRFVTFRRGRVGFTCGKPNEIRALQSACHREGLPMEVALRDMIP